ncbi:MAG: hypothetical protein ACTSVO_14590 [Candidatus Heimdallarchaeaceae archaeon]
MKSLFVTLIWIHECFSVHRKTDEFELINHVAELFTRGIKDKLIQDFPIPILIAFAFIPIITLLNFHFDGIQRIDEKEISDARRIAWKSIAI